jgi:hypothetical protein
MGTKTDLVSKYTDIWIQLVDTLTQQERMQLNEYLISNNIDSELSSTLSLYYLYEPFASLQNDIASQENWVDGKSPNEALYEMQLLSLKYLPPDRNIQNIKDYCFESIRTPIQTQPE